MHWVRTPGSAGGTGAVGDHAGVRHAPADLDRRDRVAPVDDDAGELVSENRPVLEAGRHPVQREEVGPADRRRTDGDERVRGLEDASIRHLSRRTSPTPARTTALTRLLDLDEVPSGRRRSGTLPRRLVGSARKSTPSRPRRSCSPARRRPRRRARHRAAVSRRRSSTPGRSSAACPCREREPCAGERQRRVRRVVVHASTSKPIASR